MTMKVLMYGWEFPPFFSGGLGVACHAMVQELAKKNINVAIILPHTVENLIDKERVAIVGCDTVTSNIKKICGERRCYYACCDKNLTFPFSTFLSPYLHLTETEYLSQLSSVTTATTTGIITKLKALCGFSSLHELAALRPAAAVDGKMTGKYGMNLLAEVCYYAIIAGALATTISHDVIHAHDWLTILAGIEARKRSGKPLIFHVHALETDRSGMWVDTRIFAIEKYGLEQADKVIAVSEYTKNIIIEKYGIASDKIVIVHNGTYIDDTVDDDIDNVADLINGGKNGGEINRARTNRLNRNVQSNERTASTNSSSPPCSVTAAAAATTAAAAAAAAATAAHLSHRPPSSHHRNKMVLFLGRLAQQKGPSYFIEAARKILEHRRDVHFVVAGTGDLWRGMVERVAELQLGKYIHFTGFLEHKKIDRIFHLANVYVMPSISEPFGLSCLEALSYGVPVVISKQSGVAEVLPHAIKVDFWDIDEMANKILALLDHQVLHRTTLRNSRCNLKHLTWEKTADSLINVYASCMRSVCVVD